MKPEEQFVGPAISIFAFGFSLCEYASGVVGWYIPAICFVCMAFAVTVVYRRYKRKV